MKKILFLLLVAGATLSFSCNKYCHCKLYIDGVVDKNYKGEFVKESEKACADFSTPIKTIEGKTHETKCK